MEDIIGTGEKKSFVLELGKPREIAVNAPCRFLVRTAAGSVIEGMITANNPLRITGQGDLVEVRVVVDDASTSSISAVE